MKIVVYHWKESRAMEMIVLKNREMGLWVIA